MQSGDRICQSAEFGSLLLYFQYLSLTNYAKKKKKTKKPQMLNDHSRANWSDSSDNLSKQ